MKTSKIIGGTIAAAETLMLGAGLGTFLMNFSRRPEQYPPGYVFNEQENKRQEIRNAGRALSKLHLHETLTQVTEDGLELKAELITNGFAGENEGKKLVILCHGYGDGKGCMDEFLPYYLERGFHVMIITQRTHCESQGRYITFGAKESEDILNWCRAAMMHLGDDLDIVLHGWSMGAASVYLAAAKKEIPQIRAVVFDCGYSDAEAQCFHTAKAWSGLPNPFLWYVLLCVDLWGFFLGDFRLREEASPIRHAKEMDIPLLMIKGSEDETIPGWMSKRLFDATINASYKDRIIVKGARHVMSHAVDQKAYEAALDRLFKFCF